MPHLVRRLLGEGIEEREKPLVPPQRLALPSVAFAVPCPQAQSPHQLILLRLAAFPNDRVLGVVLLCSIQKQSGKKNV